MVIIHVLYYTNKHKRHSEQRQLNFCSV